MRILILSLYYKPLNSIASSRIIAFKKYLEEFGHKVDVLTRHYSKDQLKTSNLSIAMTKGDDFEGDYYKTNDIIYTKFTDSNAKKKFSNKLPKGVKGFYNLLQLDVFHYSYVEYGLKAYEKEFSNNPHDIIIASSPPPVVLLLANELNKKYKIPWIADFRDSYIGTKDLFFIKKIKILTLNKVLNSCSGIVFVSDGMKFQNLQFFNKRNFKKPNDIIYNGFYPDNSNIEQSVIDEFEEIKVNHTKTLVYTGSIYKERNLLFFLNSIDGYSLKNTIAIVLVGIQKESRQEMENKFNHLNLFFFDKVNYSTSIEIQKRADFLLLTIWKDNYTGFSGKVFEYLYSGNNIILDYMPPKDLRDFLTRFDNIHFCNEDKNIFYKILSIKNIKKVISNENKEFLKRKKQVEKLDHFINDIWL